MAVETRIVTLEQYTAASAGHTIEIVDGEIIEMSPNTKGQPMVVAHLNYHLLPFVVENHLGKLLAEASFVLDGNPRSKWVKNARTPDLAFIARERAEAHQAKYPDPNEPWWLAPDLAVEVISPTDLYSEVVRKVQDYLRYEVRIVWVIDPKAKTVVIYTTDNPLGTILTANDTLTAVPLIEGWSMPVAALFAD